MKIAVDAMGGDHAPLEVVKGTVEISGTPELTVVLVGDEIAIWNELIKYPASCRGHIMVQHASEAVGMGEQPANIIRNKPDSSVVVCANLVKNGSTEGMFSAGNTGAVMSVATLRLGRIRGSDRPAIATVLPMTNGKLGVLLDAGANVDCTEENLTQFALMGEAYAWSILGIENPRVALLNIGEETSKGNKLTKATNKILAELKGLNFIGNLDAKRFLSGEADVIVCDGFAGNLVLKIAEGTAEAVGDILKLEMSKSIIYKLGGALMHPAARKAKTKLSYEEYGGAPLLGVNGVCLIGHGRSNSKAIANGIRATARAVKADLVWKITKNLAT
jgi:phosphate acyltransferase